jgi:D-alanyl-D-alanine-carboxypeptidase/D-alanyl-D-alanine-endopeptidase
MWGGSIMRLQPDWFFGLFVIFPGLLLVSARGSNTDEIGQILKQAIESKRSVGIVIGLVDENGPKIFSAGTAAQGGGEVDGNTVFAIGPVTMIFTATLLADMIERGEVHPSDPIMIYLPPAVKVPVWGRRDITLIDLATHSSGLPRLPGNFGRVDNANPYANYTSAKLYEFLSGYKLSIPIGRYEYSGLGYALLAHILALRLEKDYESILRNRILIPLGMTHTAITLSPEMKSSLATGHNPLLQPAGNWDMASFVGAAGLHSTVNDMLIFVAAHLGLRKSPLAAALERTQQILGPTDIRDIQIGLGWHVIETYDAEIWQENGGTGGYNCFMGFEKKKGLGVVILSNCSVNIGDIGVHLLNPRFPLAPYTPPKERKEIQLDPNVLDSYMGEYQMANKVVFVISKERDALFLESTWQPKVRLHAESETEFFIAEYDVQFSLVKNAEGKITHLVMHQRGQNLKAEKVR